MFFKNKNQIKEVAPAIKNIAITEEDNTEPENFDTVYNRDNEVNAIHLAFAKIKPEETAEQILGEPDKSSSPWAKPKGELVVDVFQTNNEFFVVATVAGASPSDIGIAVENEMLIIKGKREQSKIDKAVKKYLHQECFWGDFEKRVLLPENLDKTNIQASLKRGILTIKAPLLPVQENAKKMKVDIKE